MKEGTASIVVKVGGDGVYVENSTTVNVTVSKIASEISVANETMLLEVNDEVSTGATLTPAGAGNLTYAVSNSSVVKVVDGKIIALGEGNALITVSFAGNNKYTAAENKTIGVTVTLKDALLSVNNSTLNLNVDDTFTIVAVTVPEGLNVSYIPDNSGVVSVDDYGVVTALKEGTASIVVKVGGDGVYAVNSTTVNVTVSKIPTEIAVNDTLELTIDDEDSIKATLTPAEAGTLTYASSNPAVVSVDVKGNVKAIGAGEATIAVSFAGNDKYAASENKTIKVTVKLKDASVSVKDDTVELKVNDEMKLVFETAPEGLEVTFESDNPDVATVSVLGKVEGHSVGTATITLKVGDGKVYAENSTAVSVTVSLNDASVSVENDTLDLKVDDVVPLVVVTVPGGLNVSFVSSDSEVASVSALGKVTAHKEGAAVITVKVGDGKVYAENSTTVAITVSKIPTEIVVSGSAGEMYVGEMGHVEAELNPSEAGKLSYASNDTGVVDVSSTGVFKANNVGTAIIAVSFNGTDKYAAAESKNITVRVNLRDAGVTVNNATLDLKVGDEFTVVATTVPAGLNVIFVPDNSGVVSIDDNGVVTALKEGTASITVKVGDGKVYAENSTSVNVTVSKISTEISVDPISLDLFVGDETVIAAVLTPADAGNVTFTSSDDSVVSVDAKGNVIAQGKGQVIITVSFVGNEKYAACENKTVTVTVSLNDASVTVDNDTLNLEVDETYQINAHKKPDTILLDINYTSSNESVACVDENGTVTAVGEGAAIITVEVGDDKVYAKNSTNVTVNVGEKTAILLVNNLTKYYHGPERFNVSVVDLKGNPIADKTVQITINGVTYNRTTDKDGIASIAINLNSGIYPVEVTSANLSAEATVTVLSTVNGTDVTGRYNEKIIFEARFLDTEGNFLKNGTDVLFNIEARIYNAKVAGDKGMAEIGLDLGAGTYTITAINTVTGENAANIITVVKDDSNISLRTYDINVDEINASVADIMLPRDATGNVTMHIGNQSETIEITAAILSVNNTGMPAGEYGIEVTYNGDRNYEPSSAKGSFTISKLSCEANITADDYNVKVELPHDATGNVTLTIGNETSLSAIENGIAQFNISNLPAGQYNASVTYPGDDTYNPFSEEIEITVKDKSIKVSAPDVEKYYGGSERFVVSVTDIEGNPLENKSVKIILNGVTYDKTTDANGSASIGLNLNSGKYDINTTVDNITVSSLVTVKATVNATDLVKVFRNATQFYATFLDSDGNYLAKGTVVSFNINGVFYNRTVEENGLAKLNINLEWGNYIITSMNTVTGENAANNVTVISRIIENNDLTKYYRNASQYTVKIIGDDGNPVCAGETVTFNINGVFYNRTTDESGIAKLNINLQPGNYIITAEYRECRVSNNITVLQVLSAEDLVKKYATPDQFVATLVDGQGNPYANQTVTFNINGVFYNKVTDGSGQANLDIRLMPGEYIITSSYNGTNIANKITVKR